MWLIDSLNTVLCIGSKSWILHFPFQFCFKPKQLLVLSFHFPSSCQYCNASTKIYIFASTQNIDISQLFLMTALWTFATYHNTLRVSTYTRRTRSSLVISVCDMYFWCFISVLLCCIILNECKWGTSISYRDADITVDERTQIDNQKYAGIGRNAWIIFEKVNFRLYSNCHLDLTHSLNKIWEITGFHLNVM